MRRELCRKQESVTPPALVQLESLRVSDLREAAAIMLAAYHGGVDAEMAKQYRTYESYELVLQNLLGESGGGIPILEASAMARHRGRGIGFIILYRDRASTGTPGAGGGASGISASRPRPLASALRSVAAGGAGIRYAFLDRQPAQSACA